MIAGSCCVFAACLDSGAAISDTEATAVAALGEPAPPAQAPSGPGGADYLFASAFTTFHGQTNDDLSYWTIEPRDWSAGGAAPAQVPLIVFLHGWGGNDPFWYTAWLTHLARKGNLIIFPKFQNLLSIDQFYTGNAVWSVRDALAALQLAPIKPLTWYGMSLVGHSVGGNVAANLAHRWASEGLPVPRSILLVMPFGNPFTLDSLAQVPAFTMLDCVIGQDDTIAGRAGCDLVWSRTPQLAARNYLVMPSDVYGAPDLVASHFTPNLADALAQHGLWKLGDALRDCTFGSHCSSALGNTPEQRSLGVWSDGTPVRELSVTTSPPP
jgi:pimeloyl-ACP methyl ester carboxylesterase